MLCLRPGFGLGAVAALLQRHGVRAEPMHPGSRDALLAVWFALHGTDAALAAALPALQRHEAVDAAYLSPPESRRAERWRASADLRRGARPMPGRDVMRVPLRERPGADRRAGRPCRMSQVNAPAGWA